MMSKFKVLVYEKMHSQGTSILENIGELIYAETLKEDYLAERAQDADAIIIRANGAVTRKVIDAAPRLKVIGRHGVGLDAIDLNAARERGISVVFTPDANKESVAEHFVGLALMLAKKMRMADIELRKGNWQARYELIGTELFGKTVGVMGFGRIGQQTARICHRGFQMKVIYCDEINYPDPESELSARKVDKETLFRDADFISINMPLLPSTKGIVNADLIKLMKPTAFLVNMARGPLWNEADVVAALRDNRIAGARSVVYEVEPIRADNPLFQLDNFIGTPHMSAHTEEAMIKMSLVAEDVLAVLDGRKPRYPVNL